MATTDMTASFASGYLTDAMYYDLGPLLAYAGHYSSPASGTAIFETGMYNIAMAAITNVDIDTQYYSANANGTYAVLASGLTTGTTGFFLIQGW